MAVEDKVVANAFSMTQTQAKVVITKSLLAGEAAKATSRSAQTKIATTIEASEAVKKMATEVMGEVIAVMVGLRIEVDVAILVVVVSINLTKEK